MGFDRIIAARNKRKLAGVAHMDIGGAIGGGALGTLVMGPMAAIPGAIAGAQGSGVMGGVQAIGNDVSHAAQNLVPTDRYQATTPGITTTNFAPGMALGQSAYNQGVGTMAGAATNLNNTASSLGGVLGQQQTLAQALQAQANGQGPNPAQAQYQQNVNQAIAQNAGTLASTRGLSSALAARLANNAGSQMLGNAAGNAATLEAQQQIAAQQQLAQQQAAEAGTVAAQGNLYGAAGGLGSSIAGAGNTFYGTNVTGQSNQNNAVNTGSLGAQGINAGVAQTNTQAKAGLEGGVLNAGGGALGSALQGPATVINAAPAAAAAMAGGGEVGVDGTAMNLARALMAGGGRVPGKAQHPGNDPRNDVVPTVLSKGEGVIPNTIMDSPDAPEKAARFVAALKEKRGEKAAKAGKGSGGYGQVLKKVRALRSQIAEIEQSLGRAS